MNSVHDWGMVNDWSVMVDSWGSMDDWYTMIIVSTSVRERYCHSNNTLTLSRLGLRYAQHGMTGRKWRLGQHARLGHGREVRRYIQRWRRPRHMRQRTVTATHFSSKSSDHLCTEGLFRARCCTRYVPT